MSLRRGMMASAGALPWTPADLAMAPKLWLNDTGSVTDAGSGACSQWNDVSGSGWHVSQPTSGSRPLIVASGLNSKRIIRFDNTNDYMITTATAARDMFRNVGAGYMLAVAKKNAVDGTDLTRPVFFSQIGADASVRAAMYLGAGHTGHKNYFEAFGVRVDGETAAGAHGLSQLDTGWHLLLATFDWQGRLLTTYLDGDQYVQNTALGASGGNTSNTAAFGGLLVGGAIGFPSNADVAEVIVSSGATLPDSDDIDRLFGYAAHRWGLTANLDVSHPYKASAPTNPPEVESMWVGAPS